MQGIYKTDKGDHANEVSTAHQRPSRPLQCLPQGPLLAWRYFSRLMRTISRSTTLHCPAPPPQRCLYTPQLDAVPRDSLPARSCHCHSSERIDLSKMALSDVRKPPNIIGQHIHVGGRRTTRFGAGRCTEDLHDVGSVRRHLGPFPEALL